MLLCPSRAVVQTLPHFPPDDHPCSHLVKPLEALFGWKSCPGRPKAGRSRARVQQTPQPYPPCPGSVGGDVGSGSGQSGPPICRDVGRCWGSFLVRSRGRLTGLQPRGTLAVGHNHAPWGSTRADGCSRLGHPRDRAERQDALRQNQRRSRGVSWFGSMHRESPEGLEVPSLRRLDHPRGAVRLRRSMTAGVLAAGCACGLSETLLQGVRGKAVTCAGPP